MIDRPLIALLLDMSAFKAANPDAIFEDFIRWHSPGDWEEYDHHHVVLLTLKSQKIVGLHKESFQRECLNMEIYGESFGIVHLLFLLLNRNLFLIRIGKEKK